MPLPLEVYLIAPLIVMLAYAVYAVSGFGSTLIAVPLLAHLLPIKFVIPLDRPGGRSAWRGDGRLGQRWRPAVHDVPVAAYR
jgi:hypothetical protein